MIIQTPSIRPSRSFAALSFAAYALIALVGCGTTPHSPEDQARNPAGHDALSSAVEVAEPPFFRVEAKGGATLLLLGTIHIGPEEGWKLSAEVERSLVEADAFAMEIDLRNLNPDAVGSSLARLVVLPVDTTLDDVISPETAKLISENEALIASLGAPEQTRRRLKPWYLAMSLLQVAIGKTQFSLEKSAESLILEAAADRPLRGLETFDEQLSMLNELSVSLQDAMLRDTLGRLDETLAEMNRLIHAWESGDRDELMAISRQGISEMPELEDFYDVLLTDRNQKWLGPLREALEDPKQADSVLFVAVGALHLVGPDGVPQLLKDAGYEVSTIH